MAYNPGTVVRLTAKDDTHIAANAVAPEHVQQLGTVRVVIGTSVDLYLTAAAAATLVRQVLDVFAGITRPQATHRDVADDAPVGEIPPDMILTSDGHKYPVDGGA